MQLSAVQEVKKKVSSHCACWQARACFALLPGSHDDVLAERSCAGLMSPCFARLCHAAAAGRRAALLQKVQRVQTATFTPLQGVRAMRAANGGSSAGASACIGRLHWQAAKDDASRHA